MTGPILLGLASALGVLALFLGVWWIATVRDTHRATQRVKTDVLRAQRNDDDRWWALFEEPGQRVDSWFDENGETDRLLVQAGLRNGMQRGAYFATQALLPMGGVGLVIVAVMLGRLEGPMGFILGFGVACGFLLAPRIWLRRRAGRRQVQVKSEVAMFIHLLALLFDAGLSLRQALASLVREGHGVLPVIGQEIRIVLRQLEAGADPSEALHAMGKGLDIAELNAVLGVLRQVDRYGGELREPLMEALSVVEERRQLSLREKVNGLSGRMTVVMVLFFFPALLIFVAGPAFLSITRALGS